MQITYTSNEEVDQEKEDTPFDSMVKQLTNENRWSWTGKEFSHEE